jgi:CRISPR-associated endonuclease/helicase Cas3
VIDAPTEPIIVPYNDEAKSIILDVTTELSIKETARLLKKAQQYTVNVFPYMIKELYEEKALYEVYEGSEICYRGIYLAQPTPTYCGP